MKAYRSDYGLAPAWKVFLACGPLNPAFLIVVAYCAFTADADPISRAIGMAFFLFTLPGSVATLVFLSPWSERQRPHAHESLGFLFGWALVVCIGYSAVLGALLAGLVGLIFAIPIGMMTGVVPGALWALSSWRILEWLDGREPHISAPLAKP